MEREGDGIYVATPDGVQIAFVSCINELDECEQIYAIHILLEMNLKMYVSLERMCLE